MTCYIGVLGDLNNIESTCILFTIHVSSKFRLYFANIESIFLFEMQAMSMICLIVVVGEVNYLQIPLTSEQPGCGGGTED